jgi:Periplasmic protein involved in polysaccharide export
VKKILAVFITLILITSYILADSANTGGAFSGATSTFSGNGAFGDGGAFNTGSSMTSDLNSSPLGDNSSNSSNVAIGSMPQMTGGNQGSMPQIMGGDHGGRDDRINNYRRDDYNSYNGLTGRGGGGISTGGSAAPSSSASSGGGGVTQDEFQQNVQTRTGLLLERYGYNLFKDSGAFAANTNLPASNNYILGPGDEISIKAWGAISISYTATISKNGSIFIPKVGSINLTGVKASHLESYLKEKIGSIFRNFSVSASVTNISSIQVNVTGFAKKPGTYMVSSISTLTNAIFASGGPSEHGSLRHIILKRNGVAIADYDMYNLLLNGNDGGDMRLLSGDVIYIRPYGRQVAIYDGVKVAGIYEAKEHETIKDIVRFAGGYTFNNTKKEIIVERIVENHKIKVSNYSFDHGLKKHVENGDIIHFFRMPNRYDDAVVLIGNIANPSRFNWHEGMRVKDIIPNKEMLLTKSFWNSYSKNSYVKDKMVRFASS